MPYSKNMPYLDYDVKLGPQRHSFFNYPAVTLQRGVYTPPAQPMGNISVTTGSSTADTVLKWGFWIGLGLAAHRLYRVLRYNDPFIQWGGGTPAAWEMNPEAEDLATVCAWCKRMRVGDRWVSGEPETDLITHGICERCEERMGREIEQYEAQPQYREARRTPSWQSNPYPFRQESHLQLLRKHVETDRSAYPKLTDEEYENAVIEYELAKRALFKKQSPRHGIPKKNLWRLKLAIFGEPTGYRKAVIETITEEPYWKVTELAMYFGASEEQVFKWLKRAGFDVERPPGRARYKPTKDEFFRKRLHGMHVSKGIRRSRRNPKAEELARVCGWCKRMFVEGEWVPGEPTSEWITHGLCEQCEEQVLREIEEEEERERSR